MTVAVTGDTTDEPHETVVVTLSSPTHGTLPDGGASGTGTITDDDAAPTVTVAVAPTSISENGGMATLSHASSAATTVAVTPVSGLYTVGADATTVVAAGSTANASDTATITSVDDAIDNVAARSGTVMATAQNSQGIGAVTGAALTLTDDEPTPTVALNLMPASIVENGGMTTVTARLSGASSEAVTLTVSATAGTNAQAEDFTLSSARTLTLAAGATASTGAVTITATDDARDGPNKAVTVSATGTGTSGVAAPGSRTLSIVDDDGAPSLSIDAARVVEGDTSTMALTFTVRLSPAGGQQVTVSYADAATGTATAGTDYTVITGGTLIFAAGATSRTIAVSVTGDTVEEADETVVMTLRGPTNAVLGTATGTGTIMDDDAAPPRPNDEEPPPVPTDSVPSFGAQTVEDRAWKQGQEIVAFTLPAATGGDPPVRHDLQPDLPAGVTRTAFQVSGTPTVPVETTTYTWTATDTDGDAAALTFTLSVAAQAIVSIADASAVEGSALAFPVTLSAAAPADVTLTWTTEPGTAQPAADYTPAPARRLTIPAGETTATVMVPTTDDDVAEPEETFTVRLAAAGLPAGVTLGTAAATGTITNDDTLVKVTVGTVVYIIDGRRVTVTGLPGIPDGVEIDLPTPLDRDVAVTVAPPAADLPLESARFGLGRQANRRTIADVTIPDVPARGLTLCLPVRPGLRPEADGQGLALVHYDGNAWERVAQSQDMDGKVCAAGVTDFSPFAVGYERPAESGPNVGAVRGRALGMALAGVGRTAATDAVEVVGTRFARTAPTARANLGGQTLPLHREADAGRWRRAAGVAYCVARTLGMEIVSPLAGGPGTFGPPGGATWRTLTRTATDTTSAAPDPWGGTLSGERRGMPRDVAWTHPDGMIHVAGYPSGIAQLGFDRAHAAHRARAAAWTLRKPVSFRRISTIEMLSQSAFTAPLGKPDAPGWISGWTLWGRGTAGGFDGEPKDGFSMDGEVFTGYVGLGYRLQQNVLLGLAVAHSRGDVDYETADATRGDVDLRLTSVLPYAHWTPRPGLGVWGLSARVGATRPFGTNTAGCELTWRCAWPR